MPDPPHHELEPKPTAQTSRASTEQSSAGRRQLGDYWLEDQIGQGPTADLFVAEHKKLGRRVALKVASDSATTEEQDFESLWQGGRIAARLQLPQCAEVFAVDEVEGQRFVARALVPGSCLRQALSAQDFSSYDAVLYSLQLAENLAGIHQLGVTHGNLKPTNVIRCDDGSIVLVDVRAGGTVAGDLQALGAVLWQLLSATLTSDQAIPDELARICSRTSIVAPDRYQHVSQLVDDLRCYVERHYRSPQSDWRQIARIVRALVMLGAGGLLLLVVSGLAVLALAVALLEYSPGQYGVVLQTFLQTASIPLLGGAYLTLSGFRSLRGPTSSLPPTILNHNRPLEAETNSGVDGAPAEETTEIGRIGSARVDQRPPPGSSLKMSVTDHRWQIKRRIGSRAGSVVGALTVALGLLACIRIVNVPFALLQPPVVSSLIIVLAWTVACLCIIRWLWVRPKRVESTARKWPMGLATAWLGDETLVIDPTQLCHTLSVPWRSRTRCVPLAEIWGVGRGDKEMGLEVATQDQPLRIGVKLADDDRHWLSRALMHEVDRRRSASGTDEILFSDISHNVPNSAPRSWLVLLLAVYGWLIMPSLTTLLMVADLRSPSAFEENSSWQPLESSLRFVSISGNLIGLFLTMAGSSRLWMGRRSGARLLKAGFWTWFALFLTIWITALILNSFELLVTPEITPAINLSCLAFSLRLMVGMGAIVLLSAYQPKLKLRQDD